MKKFPIHRNLKVTWIIKGADGSVPTGLHDRLTQLYFTTGCGRTEVLGYTIEGNVLTWIFPASEQFFAGNYSLTLIAANGDGSWDRYDIFNAFRLKWFGCMLGVDTDGVTVELNDDGGPDVLGTESYLPIATEDGIYVIGLY